MKKLYAPWRSPYARDVASDTKREDTKSTECVFCTQFGQSQDHAHGILRRFEHTVVMLNKYPYNAGHILILPREHHANLPDLSPAQRAELIEVVSYSQSIVLSELEAHGINMGVNAGKAAGAGIPSHLHFHVVPRFAGDTNFMPILGDTKPISIDLNGVYDKLKPAFEKLKL